MQKKKDESKKGSVFEIQEKDGNKNKNLLPFSKMKKREEILKALKLGKKYHLIARNSY